MLTQQVSALKIISKLQKVRTTQKFYCLFGQSNESVFDKCSHTTDRIAITILASFQQKQYNHQDQTQKKLHLRSLLYSLSDKKAQIIYFVF